MNVFCDLHHYDLYYSLQLLFEKRLGMNLFRAIGPEWAQEGYWKVWDHPATIQQYLGIEAATEFNADPSLDWLNQTRYEQGSVYYVQDLSKDHVSHKAIRLETFKQMKFDLIISTLPQHIQPFLKLGQLYQPKAKHIFQLGNSWGYLPGVKNIMASTAAFAIPAGVNSVFYHQEFDLDIFQYQPPTQTKQIKSYVQFMQNLELRNQFQEHLPDYQITSFGGGMEQSIAKTKDIGQHMKDSDFTWHWKPQDDGYGHVLHNTFACGRPAIVYQPHYKTRLGGQLMEHGKTCIDISKFSVSDASKQIQFHGQPEQHNQMCENAHKRFCEIVNFDYEEQLIRKFLERLI